MDYLTDTHPLVWYFMEDERLSLKASNAFEETLKEGLILVPTIVLAELMYIAQKGKTVLTFAETLTRLEMYENFEIVPLDVDVLKTADTISVDLEMHDRLIVATALFSGVPLITKDETIASAKVVETIW
ncbi:MAG: PIN domain-containing protein [Deltaproteobacteria bacterium]|nr:PIN domain-containing protein [Deltaproteobacteria bacterium]MBL7075787.1 PIN domain-containing protein [candidate division KSB1 bacterium]